MGESDVSERLRAAGLKVKPLDFAEGRNGYWRAQDGYQVAQCHEDFWRVRLHGKVICQIIKGFDLAVAWANKHYERRILSALEVCADDSSKNHDDGMADIYCPGCQGGDKVPASADYWRCPVCDAEWFEEDAG